RLRIAIPEDYFFEVMDPEVSAAFEAAMLALTDFGWSVETTRLPAAHYAVGAEVAILSAEAAAHHLPRLKRQAAEYSADVRVQLDAGLMISATDYLLGQRARRYITDEFSAALDTFDLLAMPTIPTTAPRLGDDEINISGVTIQTASAL